MDGNNKKTFDKFGEIGYYTNMKTNWVLKTGTQTIDCISFPFAFRTAFGMVRKGVEAKQNVSGLMKDIVILGPTDSRGDRTKYSYFAACELAKDQGLLQPDGQLNSREFKKKV